MMIPGIMAQRRVVSGGGTLWTPLNMTTVPQIYLDAQDSVVTDVSGFASAISNLGAMGADGDFSQGTAGNRPAILAAELNGKRVLSFDGSNDVLFGGSNAQKNILRNKPSGWTFMVMKKRSEDLSATTTRVVFMVSQSSSGSARFRADYGFVGAEKNRPSLAGRRLDGDAFSRLVAPTESAGAYRSLFVMGDYQTGLGQVHEDAVITASNAAWSSVGLTSNTASIDPMAIGATGIGTGTADVDIASIVFSSERPSTDDIDKLFGWAAHKYGLTASLPGGHPYKTVAPTV